MIKTRRTPTAPAAACWPAVAFATAPRGTKWQVVAVLLLATVAGLTGAAGLSGCGSADHPAPPPVLLERRDHESAVPARVPLWMSTATAAQLQAARDLQAELFATYRFRPGDTFAVILPSRQRLPASSWSGSPWTRDPDAPRAEGEPFPAVGERRLSPPAIEASPERRYVVTVLPDGRVYVPFLDEPVAVEGLTAQQVAERLIGGEQRLAVCANCGYWFAADADACPACGAVRGDAIHTPRLALSDEARQYLVTVLGGLVAADVRPLRPTSEAGRWWAICEQGLVGLVERRSSRYVFRQAEVAWTLYLGRTRLTQQTLAATEPVSEILLPVQREWLRLNLISGETVPVATPPTGQTVVRPQAAPQPGGLAAQIADPQVRIADIVPDPLGYAVNVTGAVERPSRVPVRRGTRLWDVITEAGGPRRREEPLMAGSVHDEPLLPAVDWRGAVLLREARYLPEDTLPPGTGPEDLVRVSVSFERLAAGDVGQNVPVLPGDVVYLPEFVPQRVRINVAGEVGEPGVYYFASQPDLMTALLSAGWINRQTAQAQAIYLVRINRADATRDVYRLNAHGVARGTAPNLDLQDGDLLFVDTDWLTDMGDTLNKLSPLFRFAGEPLTGYLRWRVLIDDFR